jgi:proteasome assembly chaperone (PAC2) family protein
MADTPALKRPWLVAVWPGMGPVALSAGYYLMAKLGMELLTEFALSDGFDVQHVVVEKGLVQPIQRPRSRLFVWRDPAGERDLVVFLGDAQPDIGRYAFCRKLIDYAETLGAERVFTFAAMATEMHPHHASRVFGAATDEKSLEEFARSETLPLEEGQIGGLNGVLLGAAAESGISGVCLLGEMPHIFVRFPYPKASLAALETFVSIAGLNLDLSELAEQAELADRRLEEMLSQVRRAMQAEAAGEEYPSEPEYEPEPRLDPEDEEKIEGLFAQAAKDRAKAYELKRTLDRLNAFKDYEDRFLDLFKPSSRTPPSE